MRCCFLGQSSSAGSAASLTNTASTDVSLTVGEAGVNSTTSRAASSKLQPWLVESAIDVAKSASRLDLDGDGEASGAVYTETAVGNGDGGHRTRTTSAVFPLLYCIVMERGDRNLQAVIATEHIAGVDPEAIRNIASLLALGVEALHASGIVHGDLTPLNFVRVGERWKVGVGQENASLLQSTLQLSFANVKQRCPQGASNSQKRRLRLTCLIPV